MLGAIVLGSSAVFGQRQRRGFGLSVASECIADSDLKYRRQDEWPPACNDRRVQAEVLAVCLTAFDASGR